MLGELQHVGSISSIVWRRLAEALGDVSGHRALRSKVLNAAHISCGYITNKVFTVVRDYPWRPSVGDVASNLEMLRAMPDDEGMSDMCTQKIRALLRSGCGV